MDLADAEAALRRRINNRLMLSGVSIVDPATTYIDATVSIGQDTVIFPNTHLRGGARLARAFADALAAAGERVLPAAAEEATLLHDVGRALGVHEDHQMAGLEHLRRTPLAPYALACVSHFTKGADTPALVAAGVPKETAEDFRRLIDGSSLTWEERCAALADACMKGPTPVPPAQRFRDLRERYDAAPLIELQERPD